MKQTSWLITIILANILLRCDQNTKKRFGNPQQQAFDDFLAMKGKALYSQKNDIQEKEYLNQFEEDLYNYIDSVKLFINWKGVISDIETEEVGKTTALKFVIKYEPEEYRKIEFKCTHLIKTDSLESDYIYNKVKNMSDYSVVYFDGFIRTKNNGEVYYFLRSAGNNLNIAYPNYEFWVLDISSENRENTLSDNMSKSISIAYEINKALRDHFLGSIEKDESNAIFDKLLPSYKDAISILTENEQLYIQRFNTNYTYNYLYGKK